MGLRCFRIFFLVLFVFADLVCGVCYCVCGQVVCLNMAHSGVGFHDYIHSCAKLVWRFVSEWQMLFLKSNFIVFIFCCSRVLVFIG